MTVRTKEQVIRSRKEDTPRSPEELKEASWHLFYEFTMLEHCGDLLLCHEPVEGKGFAVLMESFLIHARNLNHFFYGMDLSIRPNRGVVKPEDVVVEDFFDLDDQWEKPEGNGLSKDEIQGINAQLAHISYRRQVTDRGTWDFKGMQMRLVRMFKEFVEEAPEDRLCPQILGAVPRSMYPPRPSRPAV